MSRDLPGVHEPDRMLNAMARGVDAALKACGASLERVSLGPDGTLRMEVRAAGQAGALVWAREAPGGVPVERFGGVVSAGDDVAGAVGHDLARAVARLLGALDPRTFPMLVFREKGPGSFSFDEKASEVLFGGLLSPGLTRWRGWVCETITQRNDPGAEDPAGVEVAFRAGGQRMVVCLRPGQRTPIAVEVDAVEGVYRVEPNGPDAYLRFLVGRRVPPGTVVTLPPPPKSDGGYGGTGKPRQHEWGPRRGWYRFFHMPDVEGDYEERRLFTGRCVHVTFGERECHTSHPCFAGVNCGKVASPAVDAWRSGFADTVTLASVLTEGDLTKGPMPVFERLMAQAEELRGEDGIVVFQDSCVSVMVGEDVTLFRTGESARRVVVRASDNMRSQNAEMLDTFFGRCRRRRDAAPAASGGGAVVNLVGYDPHRGRPELEALLRASGIEVATCFTPDYDIYRVDDVFRASLNVLYPARHRSRLYATLPECTGVEGFLPPPPYGVEGTRAWLLAVAGRFGRRAEAERAFEDHLRRLGPEVEREREAARGVGVILVVSRLDAEVLTDPPACLGVPLVAMLRDLGFDATVFFRLHEGVDEPMEPALRRLKREYPDLPVRTFHDPAGLDTLMRESRARLVYSDVFDDWRVTGHGKVPFNLRHLPMGVEGAVVAARTLNRKARVWFYEQYRGYLGAGADAPL